MCGGPVGVLTIEEESKRGLTEYAEKQMDDRRIVKLQSAPIW